MPKKRKKTKKTKDDSGPLSRKEFGGKTYTRYSASSRSKYRKYQKEAKEWRKSGVPARVCRGKDWSALYIRK